MLRFLGPVQRLRLWTTMFPHLATEEEQAMRNADMVLQAVPIIWYCRLKVQSNKKINSSLLLNAVKGVTACSTACRDTSINNNANRISSKNNEPRYSPYFSVDSTINVVDTKAGPALEIVSNQYNFEDSDCNATTNKQIIMKKVFPFRDMEIVIPGEELEWESIGITPNENTFMIFGRQNNNANNVQADKFKSTSDQSATSTMGDMENSILATDSIENSSLSSPSQSDIARIFACQLVPDSKLSLSRDEAIRHLNALVDWVKLNPSINKKESINDKLFSCVAVANTWNKSKKDVYVDKDGAIKPTSTTIKFPQSSIVNQVDGYIEQIKALAPSKNKEDDVITLPPSIVIKKTTPPSPTSVLTFSEQS